MPTFSSLRSRIADDLNRSDLTSQINNAINDSINFYRKQRFWFSEGTVTYTTTPDQETLSITSTVQIIDYVEVVDSTSYATTMTKVNYSWIKENNPDDSTGKPSAWAWYKNQLFLYPVPDITYTVELSYLKNYVDLSADADTNDFTSYAYKLIQARARWQVQNVTLRDVQGAAISKAEEQEALSSLIEQNEEYIKTDTVTPDNFCYEPFY